MCIYRAISVRIYRNRIPRDCPPYHLVGSDEPHMGLGVTQPGPMTLNRQSICPTPTCVHNGASRCIHPVDEEEDMAFLYAAVKASKGLPSQKQQWPMPLPCLSSWHPASSRFLAGLNAIQIGRFCPCVPSLWYSSSWTHLCRIGDEFLVRPPSFRHQAF